ncbi:ankyrin [Pseudovirgaria hyperparasitica]|uniref:Ankyrin n=1 Tax=Pseudovirgaria hyperparasitica TaxID=470096 RepID=A0A6A6VRI3_9PEZI|nr:ankyrin [Pseudovirgaria hyperparasitica]KAF2752396.1 ankyrin [Pseudovirgaria hyperparasitica]
MVLPASNMRPPLQLRNEIKVPDSAQSVRFAVEGNIDGLKLLFSQGLASPTAVSNTREFSLVRWALYGGMHNFETVKFLLNHGAFVDDESYHHVWDYAYRHKCTIRELNELRCITMNPPDKYEHADWFEEQQFPLVHKIILGRSSKLLKDELDSNPDAIRSKDAMGRTALDWATALSQLAHMRLLIDRGSPVDTMDIDGRTTILHAVDSHNNEVLRILLEAGASPNPKVPKDLFRSSPLISATFGGLIGMVELLIKFGAEINHRNPEGRTALQTVASMQTVEFAEMLLNHGADLSYVANNGHSPFTTAITFNNHAVLRHFLERCDSSQLSGLQLLPIVAEWADVTTMTILASSDILKHTLADRADFITSINTLLLRTDYDKALDDAFQKFSCQNRYTIGPS